MKNYARGERNAASKLTDADVELIRAAYDARCRRIDEIDRQIEMLQLERMRLRDRVSYKQLALKFEVSEVQVARIIRLEQRG